MPSHPDRVYRPGDVAQAQVVEIDDRGLGIEIWDTAISGLVPTPELLTDLDGRHIVLERQDVLHAIVLDVDDGRLVLSMKALQQHMSSGPGYYEGELYNVIRNGRGVPSVPLVIVGVAP